MSECRNTDKTLHENVDCRILWTEQHGLGIDVGGHVIVKDPVQWHRLAKTNAELLAACEDVKKIIGGFDAGLELGEAKAILKRFKAAIANAQPQEETK